MAVRYSGGFGKKPSYTYAPDEAAPKATGGKPQPASPRGKTIKVKAHTRVVKPKVTKPTGGAPSPSQAAQNPILDALVRQRFGGVEQNLKQQLASNARFTNGVPAWYAQAINEIKGIGAQGAVQGQQAIAQAQNYNSPAAATGTPDAAQAANARNNLNSQYATMLTRDQQANQDFLGRLSGAMQVQQGNTLNQANVQRQGILGQQGQLAQQKGDFKTTYAAQQATAQAKTDIENAKIQAGLLIAQGKTDMAQKVLESLNTDRTAKQKVARSNARTQRVNAKTQRANQQETAHQHAVSNALGVNKLALDAYKLAHPKAGKGGGSNSTYSKSKVQGFRSSWDYAEATAHQLLDKKTYKDKTTGQSKPITADVAYGALLGSTKDPDIARAAANLAYGKPISAKLRHRLAVKGVHLPKGKKNIGDVVVGVLNNLGQ